MEILDILYGVLIVFTIVIGTLLSIVLYRLIKVLEVAMEIVSVYNRVKQIFGLYSQIPEFIKDFVKGIFSSNKDDD